MKILHVTDSGGLYGAEMVLLNLVSEQIKMGLYAEIASIGEKNISEKPLETEAVKRGLRVVKFRMFPGPNLPGMLKVLRYAQKYGFDILHSHGYKGDVAFGSMPKSIRKLPLVSTLHGWTSVVGFSKNRMYEWLQKKSIKHMDAVVLVNKAMLSNPALKKVHGVNFHVVNNGIPIPEARCNDSTNQQFNDSTAQQFDHSTNHQLDKTITAFCQQGFTIGSIGRLSTEKGYRYLIEAFSLLTKRIKPIQPINHSTIQPFDHSTNTRLVIIGEGYERKQLEELVVDFGLKDKVLLPGYRDNAKQYLPYFNVFVLSSLTEGLPVTLLEAMQAKVPIVATRVGGIPDVLSDGQAGILVDPKNPKALSEALFRIYKNSNLGNELVDKAYRRLSSEYSSQNMALGYLKIYNNLIQQNSR
jgi:glycosyltransferase involved in cell wall biosynthesis